MREVKGTKQSCEELITKIAFTDDAENEVENTTFHDLTALNATELQHFIRHNWGKKVAPVLRDQDAEKVVVSISEPIQPRRKRVTVAD